MTYLKTVHGVTWHETAIEYATCEIIIILSRILCWVFSWGREYDGLVNIIRMQYKQRQSGSGQERSVALR